MKKLVRNIIFAAVGAMVLGLGFAGNAVADSAADIKYRKAVM